MTALRAFEAAARRGSLARAAEELSVTPGAVSQQVSGLEASLGVSLFTRVRQRLQLTDAGRAYRDHVGAAFDRIESATADLVGRQLGVDVTIGVLPSLGHAWLIPRLPRLVGRHPGLEIRVVTLALDFARAERTPDLDGGRIDLALYYGDGHWPGLVADRLMDERLIAVAAPSRVAATESAGAIDTLPLLHHTTRPESWAEWFQRSGRTPRPCTGGAFEHFHLLVEAARSGLGIALVPRAFVHEELARRSLIQVGDDDLPSRRAYYVVRTAGRPMGEPAASVWAWLQAEGRSTPP
ncbi:MAG: LysR substrate-binding domain-containing protein [Phycisphaerales bacterium]